MGGLPKRDIISAFTGDREAMQSVMEWFLPKLQQHVTGLQSQIEYRREHEWNAEQAREMAMEGRVTPEMTREALSDIYEKVLVLTGMTPMAATSTGATTEQIEDHWQRHAKELLVMLANPTYKYSIIGGFPPEVREDAEHYWESIGENALGTMVTLTESGEVTPDDFPADTAAVIKEVGKSMQKPDRGAG